jgi:hypothetical protein
MTRTSNRDRELVTVTPAPGLASQVSQPNRDSLRSHTGHRAMESAREPVGLVTGTPSQLRRLGRSLSPSLSGSGVTVTVASEPGGVTESTDTRCTVGLAMRPPGSLARLTASGWPPEAQSQAAAAAAAAAGPALVAIAAGSVQPLPRHEFTVRARIVGGRRGLEAAPGTT